MASGPITLWQIDEEAMETVTHFILGGSKITAVHGVAKSRTRMSDFTFTFHFHALEKEMATHSSVLAWRIPWTEDLDRLQSMGSQRVGHD